MNTLYGLLQHRQSMNTSNTLHTLKSMRKNSYHEALGVFNALALKEKCLYMIKITKRNTSRQTLAVMGLTLMVIAVNYLFL